MSHCLSRTTSTPIWQQAVSRGFSTTTTDWVLKQSIFLRREDWRSSQEEIVRLTERDGKLRFSEAWKTRSSLAFDSPLLSKSPDALESLDAASVNFLGCERVGLLLPGDKQVTFVRDGVSGSNSTAIVDFRHFSLMSQLDYNENQADLAFRSNRINVDELSRQATLDHFVQLAFLGVILGIVSFSISKN